MAAINAAIGATVGVLTITGALSPEVGGSLATALGAWVLVGSFFFVRSKVTPNVIVEAKVQEALMTPVPKK